MCKSQLICDVFYICKSKVDEKKLKTLFVHLIGYALNFSSRQNFICSHFSVSMNVVSDALSEYFA